MFIRLPYALLSVLLLASGLVGCNRFTSTAQNEIETALQSSQNQLSLTEIGPDKWEQMCTLSPYTTNESAEATLGFAWDAAGKTGIDWRDDIYVLVFTQDNQVEMHLEMPRHEGDLLNVQSSCFEFADATLYQDASGIWTTQADHTPE